MLLLIDFLIMEVDHSPVALFLLQRFFGFISSFSQRDGGPLVLHRAFHHFQRHGFLAAFSLGQPLQPLWFTCPPHAPRRGAVPARAASALVAPRSSVLGPLERSKCEDRHVTLEPKKEKKDGRGLGAVHPPRSKNLIDYDHPTQPTPIYHHPELGGSSTSP